jgi:putative DNA methylase
VRQTWLAKKKGRFVALRPNVDREAMTIDWEVAVASTAAGIGFDPTGFSKRGSTSCLLCGAPVDLAYVKRAGLAGQMGITPLAAVTVKASGRGRDYHAVGDYQLPSDTECAAVFEGLDIDPPEELVCAYVDAGFRVAPYGLRRFRDLFTPRQLATLCVFARGVRDQHAAMLTSGMQEERARAVALYLALALDRTVDRSAALCRWDQKNESITNVYARPVLPMVWDFAEAAPFGSGAGQALEYVNNIAAIVADTCGGHPVTTHRRSATDLAIPDATLDAVITDPPYYDNISYADLSDFFYVWLRRSIGHLFPDDLAGDLTPKVRELTSFDERHGDTGGGRAFYEKGMAAAFSEAHRVLKPDAPLVIVYAHKTTIGWSTLVNSLRSASFRITEAWPIDTEMPERSRGQNSSALASSIFLVARKRDTEEIGDLVTVRRALDALIAARLKRLVDAGVNGADLVIATMGAALEPYTRYASVELPNGEELPAEVFLEEVQRRVLGAILQQVHGLGEGVDAVDPATRYYVLARYSYGYGPVDFDDANNLARSASIELDDLAAANPPLATKKKGSVTLHDYSERGTDEELGLFDGNPNRPLIDVLHGLLWRSAYSPRDIKAYLDAARPDPVALRLVAQALQGRALRGEDDATSKHREQQACERLLGSWNILVEDNLLRTP